MSTNEQRNDLDSDRERALNLFIDNSDKFIGIGIGKRRESPVNDLIVRLDPKVFAEMVNNLDGFTASYEQPIPPLPTELGSIVTHEISLGLTLVYIRTGTYEWHLTSDHAEKADKTTYSNGSIEAVLRNGGVIKGKG